MANPTPPPPLRASLKGLCPRCGDGALYQGIIRFAPTCRQCGLDFTTFNVGDGPAAFLILIIGALMTGLAVTLELTAGPPWWLHLLIWPPVTLILLLGLLRVAKAALLVLEYRNDAREGRVRGR